MMVEASVVAAEEAEAARLAVSHTSISKDFDNFGDKCPPNGSKNDPSAPWDTPTNGLSWRLAALPLVSPS